MSRRQSVSIVTSAERVIGQFAESLRERVDADGVVMGWVGVVEQTMQPTTMGVWVRE